MMTELTEEAADKEILLYAVQRQMFCEASQRILDVRTAVLFMGEGIVPRILDGAVWDEHAEKVLAAAEAAGLTPEVLDGRVLHA